MPFFYTPKPRQFHYKPRFYDPEKERWEALKQKYADERMLRELAEQEAASSNRSATASAIPDTSDPDLDYFLNRVRELDREERRSNSRLTWKDLFRKREMPTWNYKPRFSAENGSDTSSHNPGEHLADFKRRNTKIQRRFDIGDSDYLKPVPAGRILLYTLLVGMLLYWILF